MWKFSIELKKKNKKTFWNNLWEEKTQDDRTLEKQRERSRVEFIPQIMFREVKELA